MEERDRLEPETTKIHDREFYCFGDLILRSLNNLDTFSKNYNLISCIVISISKKMFIWLYKVLAFNVF
jgi:hypothetical protein